MNTYAAARRKTYDLMAHSYSENRFHHAFHLFLLVLIMTNVAAALLEMTNSLNSEQIRNLHFFDLLSVMLFSVEWLLRVWSCVENPLFNHPVKGRLRFVFTPVMVADLLAILPFYLPMVFALDLRVLRLLRLFHIVRIYVERYDLMMDRV